MRQFTPMYRHAIKKGPVLLRYFLVLADQLALVAPYSGLFLGIIRSLQECVECVGSNEDFPPDSNGWNRAAIYLFID